MSVGSPSDPQRVLHALPWVRTDLDPGAPAITFLGERTYSRRELAAAVIERAEMLRSGGVGEGVRVCLFLDNGADFVLDLLAASSLGAVVVPLNTALRGNGLAETVRMMTPCVVRTRRSEVLDALPEGAVVWFVDDGPPDLPAAAPGAPAPSDVALILLTSGTTGLSKGVQWSHQMAIAFAEQTTWVMGYTGDDVLFTCLPLFHINALLCTVYPGLLTGAHVVVAPRFSASAFWSQLVDSGASCVNMMGSIPAVLWRREPAPIEREHALRLAMVLPLPADRLEFEARFGVPTTEVYGSTDTGLPLGIPFGQRRPGSCGKPTPGWQVAAVDEFDEPVPAGAIGELVTRPTIPFLGQSGYWDQPGLTLASMRNQWFHTGDLVSADDEGWYTYHGRRKEMLRVSGENVSTLAVEAALLRHPAVLEAAVFGVPSDLGEDAIAAAIVVREPLDPPALREFVRADLPYFAVPRYVGIHTGLPKTATQKVMKAALQDAGVADYWDGGPVRRS